MSDPSQIPAIILCGGRGTRMEKETEFVPKPMLQVGGRPILWHIMQGYAAHGVRRFILCLGFKGELIRDYFLNYRENSGNIQVDLKSGAVHQLDNASEVPDWEVVLAETGEDTLTGLRVEQAMRHVDATEAFVTYGDGVSDVDLPKLLDHHRTSGKLASVTAVRPSSRFGELDIEGEAVASFSEKPQVGGGWINGGFMVLSRDAISRGNWERSETLEIGLLQQLAEQKQLGVYKHYGFWQCMDTVRELDLLNGMAREGTTPWLGQR